MSQKKQGIAALGVLIGLAFFAFIADMIKNPSSSTDSSGLVLTWRDLYEHDYKTGKTTDKLKSADAKRVKIAGYVVPLVDDIRTVKEFLLVPNAQACIHVPPPPPNLIVHVKLKNALPIEKVHNPAWIEGRFEIETTTSVHGPSSFKIEKASLDEYK